MTQPWPAQSTERRETKRGAIASFFVANLWRKVATNDLHARFGTSFRSRVSELNRDPACPIIIKNRTGAQDTSFYWPEPRRGAGIHLSAAPTRVATSKAQDAGPGQPESPAKQPESITQSQPLFDFALEHRDDA